MFNEKRIMPKQNKIEAEWDKYTQIFGKRDEFLVICFDLLLHRKYKANGKDKKSEEYEKYKKSRKSVERFIHSNAKTSEIEFARRKNKK